MLVPIALLLGLWLLPLVTLQAHTFDLIDPSSRPTKAEIHIQDDQIRLILEIDRADMSVFQRIVPDEVFLNTQFKRSPLEQRLAEFSRQDFQFLNDADQPLSAELKISERRQLPASEGLNDQPREIIYAELTYALPAKPAALTIVPPLYIDGFAATQIGVSVYHRGVAVNDFNDLLSPEVLQLDWDDPWHTQFENPSLRRHQASIMSYIYIEPYEVRHELLLRIRDLAPWLDLDNKTTIEAAEWENVQQRIGDFISGKNPLQIDGQAVRVILDQVQFIELQKGAIRPLETPQTLDLMTAIAGVKLAYITTGIPRTVSLRWDLFPDKVTLIPAQVTDVAGTITDFQLNADNRNLIWRNINQDNTLPDINALAVPQQLTHFELPLASVLCAIVLLIALYLFWSRRQTVTAIIAILAFIAGVVLYPYLQISVAKPNAMTPEIKQEQALTLLQSLLKNIYRAFDFRREEDVYDKLALSVGDALLNELYLQQRRSLIVQQTGGARARVDQVELGEVSFAALPDKSLVLSYQAQWTAQGQVGHWGHSHTRKNRYRANITVEPLAGIWKISQLQLLEEQRVDP